MPYKIGMRNVKTALAVFICIVIYRIFDFGYPFFAVAATVISMESSVINSFKVGRNRVMGTALGAAMGLCFALINPGNPFLSALGVVVIITICDIFHWNKSITIATVVFISIMLNMGDGQILEYSFQRILDTSIGIVIGIGVNFLIAPYNFEKSIGHQFEVIKQILDKLIEESICYPLKQSRGNGAEECTYNVCGNMQDNLVELSESLTRLKEELKEYTSEIKVIHANEQRVKDIRSTVEMIKEIYAHLKVIAPISDHRKLTQNNTKHLEELGFHIEMSKDETLNHLDKIYNYHLDIILENTKFLQY